MYSQTMLSNFNKAGVTVLSSGTTGQPKEIFRSKENLEYCNYIANEVQKITKNSRIYTVCDMRHAGGMLAQTLPAIAIGASVEIETFNAYTWCKKIRNFTHSHITPGQAIAIMLTKNSQLLDLSNIWITCGSNQITYPIIKWFLERRAHFLANWGMSEVGPIAINRLFSKRNDLESLQNDLLEVGYSYKNSQDDDYKKLSKKTLKYDPLIPTIIGNKQYCEVKIIDNQLHVKGLICVKKGWFNTNDLCITSNGSLYYLGRTVKSSG